MTTINDHDLAYLVMTVCWMGGTDVWSEDVICEQIDDDSSRWDRIRRDLGAAVDAGLFESVEGGLRLTEDGWRVAQELADDS